MNKKAVLFSLVASLGAGVVLAQDTNMGAAPLTPPSIPEAVAPATVAAPDAEAAPVSKAKKHKAHKEAVVSAPAQHVTLTPPVSATVKVQALNVRGLPSFTGEVITKLNKGETVTMLEEITLSKTKAGEPAKWARITLPTNTPVWVNASMVDDTTKTVKATRLNVRGGPGENFNVLGRIEKGTTVKQLRKNGDWLEIETPAEASAYVSADLLEKTTGSALPEAAPALPTAPLASTPAPMIPEAAPVAPDTNNAPMPAVDTAAAPIAPALQTPAPVATTPAPVIPEVAPAPVAPVTPVVAPVAAVTPEVTNAPSEEPLPKRIVNREGIVVKSKNIQAPTYYELRDSRSNELLDYLSATNLVTNLVPYNGKKVLVTGEEAMDRRWKFTPVIDIQAIELR